MIRGLLSAAIVLVGALATERVLTAADRRTVLPPRLPRVRGLDAPSRLADALSDAGVGVPPATVWSWWLATVAVAVSAAIAVGGPGLALVAGAALVGAPGLVLVAARGRALRKADAALPEVLDAVARSLRSGATLPVAMGEAATGVGGRVGDDLGAIADRVERGLPLVTAIEGWPVRCPTPGVRLTAAAFALAAEAGGAAAQAVDGLATTLRANRALDGEVRAQAAQARLSALVIALAPLVFGALAAGADQRTASFLLRTPFGLACLAAGLALDGLAAWWMHRITAAPA